ncbi:MAG: 2-dehydro-3-deoxygalactonokinase [Desulfofustis sp.]|nr:2-dehydro-3-deoxygalactonokinase [Desulfofustis sp.]
MSSLIGIDWGTTTFRAYLYDQSSTYVDRISSAAGIMQELHPDFENILYDQIGSWLTRYPSIPIIASGMITSRQGWVETPYLACPASLENLGKILTAFRLHDGRDIHFVAGVSQQHPTANIMRGEETQMAGLASRKPTLAVLPGTHSKWIWMADECISRFTTFITGELFTALTERTILGRLITDQKDPTSFRLGVEEGYYSSSRTGGILSQLFGARAKPILGLMQPDAVYDYISGLLLGTEVKEAVELGVEAQIRPLVCGSSALVTRYQKALQICGFKVSVAEQDSASTGLYRIAVEAGLLAR